MSKKTYWVKLREAGSAPGLTKKRHGIRDYSFRHGVWETGVDEETTNYLRTLKTLHGVPMFEVASGRAEALAIAAKNKGVLAGVAAENLLVTSGTAGTDDDLLAHAAAVAEARAEEKIEKSTEAPSGSAQREAVATRKQPLRRYAPRKPDTSPIETPEKKGFDAKEIRARLTSAIGSELTESVFEAFGRKVADVIRDDPEQLLNVEGIGKGRLRKILQAIK